MADAAAGIGDLVPPPVEALEHEVPAGSELGRDGAERPSPVLEGPQVREGVARRHDQVEHGRERRTAQVGGDEDSRTRVRRHAEHLEGDIDPDAGRDSGERRRDPAEPRAELEDPRGPEPPGGLPPEGEVRARHRLLRVKGKDLPVVVPGARDLPGRLRHG